MQVQELQYPAYISGPIWLNAGEKFAQQRVLPDGKKFLITPKRSDVTPADILGRAGVTHLENQSLGTSPAERLKLWVLPGQGDLAGNSIQNMIDYARRVAPVGIDGGQIVEGPIVISATGPEYIAYVETRLQQALSPPWNMGDEYRNFGEYGSFDYYSIRWPRWYDKNPKTYRHFYNSVEEARQSCLYFQRNAHTKMGANVSFYPFDFNFYQGYYQTVHAIEVMRLGQEPTGRNAFCPLFYWGEIENAGRNGLHNNTDWQRRTTSPAGTIYCGEEHPQCDFNFNVAICFGAGLARGSGVVSWNPKVNFSTNENIMSNRQGANKRFVPDVPGQQIQTANDYYPDWPQTFIDAPYVASEWYCQMDRTQGEQWKYGRYRTKALGAADFSDWVEPAANNSSIIDYATRGQIEDSNGNVLQWGGSWDAMYRIKNNAADFFLYNPYLGAMGIEIVEFQLGPNGPVFTQALQGGKMHVFRGVI